MAGPVFEPRTYRFTVQRANCDATAATAGVSPDGNLPKKDQILEDTSKHGKKGKLDYRLKF